MTRPRRRVSAKVEYQWFGGIEGQDVQSTADTTESDLFQLRPSFLSADGKTSGKVVRCILDMSIRRITTAVGGPVCWAVRMAPVDSAGTVLDILELDNNDPFVWGNKRLVQCGMMDVPPFVWNGGTPGIAVLSGESRTYHYDFKINRKVDWKREAVVLQVNNTPSDMLRLVAQWRLLVQM